MKKIIITLAAIAAAFTFVSCEKDNTIKEENNAKTVLYASTADAVLTKAELSGNDTDGYQVLWEAGDEVLVVDGSYFTKKYTLTAGAGTTEGTFESDAFLSGNATCDAYYPYGYAVAAYDPITQKDTFLKEWTWNQTYSAGTVKGLPMTAQFTTDMSGNASALKFKNEGGILRLKVKNEDGASLKSITISSGDELTSAVERTNKQIVLDCGTSGVALSSTGTEFLISMPAGEYSASKFQILFTSTDGKTKTMKLASKPMVITRSQITAATLSVSFAQQASNALPYAFEINSNGDKVLFSKGNLYWDGNSNSFGFENDQASVSSDYKTQFFYSKSVSVAVASSYSDASAASDDVLFTNATETTANPNFTVAGETGKWRVLSKAESVYLKSKYKYAYVYIEGNGALILFPTGVTVPTNINKKEMVYDATWSSKFAELLAKDCVVIPMRYDYDWYWTSTSSGDTQAYANYIAVADAVTQGYMWQIGVNNAMYDLRLKEVANRIRLVMDYTE